MYSIEELANDFRKLGIRARDTVMLHASVRAVGEVVGGNGAMHRALESVLTSEGTLMMYASCPRYYDELGRGNLATEQELEIREKLPAFDPLTARSARDHGILVEFLRTYRGSRVNRHVARFVFWGKQSEHLISSQPTRTSIPPARIANSSALRRSTCPRPKPKNPPTSFPSRETWTPFASRS